MIFGLLPIRYVEHLNEVFEWIILFISGIRMLITALTKLCSEIWWSRFEGKFYWDYKRIKYFAELVRFLQSWNRYARFFAKIRILHVHDAARKQSSILNYFNRKWNTSYSKISIYLLSPAAFKSYQSKYRSKYSLRCTQPFIEGKNFEFFAISNICYLKLFSWSRGSSR